MGVGGQRHAPAALPPGKTRYPLYRRLGGPHSRAGQMRKISPPTGIRTPDRPARNKSLYRLSYWRHTRGGVAADRNKWQLYKITMKSSDPAMYNMYRNTHTDNDISCTSNSFMFR